MTAWTLDEVRELIGLELESFDVARRESWQQHEVVPFTVPWHRVACQLGGDEIWVLAREAGNVLVYDCVVGEFGVGQLDEFGVLREFVESDPTLLWAFDQLLARTTPVS